jgi:HAD superfamily hydrolase (TIGR01509 family)
VTAAIAALLFDLDGTLVHSDPLHHEVFRDIFAEFGVPLTWDQYRADISGRHNDEIFAHFLPDHPDQAATLAHRKEEEFRSRLSDSVEPAPGIGALLDWAVAADIGMAVVTNAPRANAVAMLGASGLAHRFEIVIAEGEAARGKPDPAPYALAMERLGAAPGASVAFEDSRSGLTSARGAGAHVFGMTSSQPPEALLQAGAHQAIADFTDSALWAFLDQRRP